MYTVKEIATKLHITEHTVRFYSDQGLIPPVKRDKNNNRIFDDACLNWFIGVKHLRNSGMSIEAIKEYVRLCLEGDQTIKRRYEILKRQKEIAEIDFEEARLRLDYMTKKLDHYQDIINKTIEDDMNMANW